MRTVRLYDLRHSAATLAVAVGVSVKVISEQLGHASISFTLERYSHVLPSIQDEAAARVERQLMGQVTVTPSAESAMTMTTKATTSEHLATPPRVGVMTEVLSKEVSLAI